MIEIEDVGPNEELQLALPIVGEEPVSMTFPPLGMAQLILYRSDLLAGSLIEPINKEHNGICHFIITAPNQFKAHKIIQYIKGEIR